MRIHFSTVVPPRGNFTSAGGVMTVPIKVTFKPTEDLHAVNKLYVDTVARETKPTKLTGVFLPARLPSFSGDLTSIEGYNVLKLKSSGVIPGIYTKVTVNDKGLATYGDNISAADLPDIPYSKVSSGRPTNAEGLGITDIVSATSGGTMTGFIKTTVIPTEPMHAVNKAYVKDILGINATLIVGVVYLSIMKLDIPVLLPTDGSLKLKSAYPKLNEVYQAQGYPYKKDTDTDDNYFRLPEIDFITDAAGNRRVTINDGVEVVKTTQYRDFRAFSYVKA